MPKITPPKNVRIKALQASKSEAIDLTAPGGGTPWEDRGSVGTVKAFFLTCAMGMKSPRMLFNSIRLVETTSEAMRFALGCGLMWGVGILLTGGLRLAYAATRPHAVIDFPMFAMQFAALTIGMIAALAILTWLGARILHALVSAELKGKVPPSLMVNLMAYCLGPSLLALIPFVGWALAAVGILVLMIIACASRLHVGTQGAATCSVITFGALALIVGAVALAWWMFAWQQWYQIVPPPPPPVIRSFA